MKLAPPRVGASIVQVLSLALVGCEFAPQTNEFGPVPGGESTDAGSPFRSRYPDDKGGLVDAAGLAPSAPSIDASAPGSDATMTPDAGGDAALPISYRVDWPMLTAFARNQMQPLFPTYLAHLIGKTVQHPVPLELACVTLNNPRATAVTLRVLVDFKLYAEAVTENVTVPPGASVRRCPTPVFDFARLYALTGEAQGRIELSLIDLAANRPVATNAITFAIAPVGDVSWVSPSGLTTKDMRDLSATLVTPRDPLVDRLQRDATEISAFKLLGPMALAKKVGATAVTIPPTDYYFNSVFVESDEAVNWQMQNVQGGSSTVDVYLLTSQQLQALLSGANSQTTAAWTGSGRGAAAVVKQLPSTWYYLMFVNRASTSAVITWSRAATREDVVEDSLRAVFLALRAAKITYSNITDTYFNGWQHVRLANETLKALSANCFDGSLLFASVLELVGLEPVVVFVPGHAFVGARLPGGKVWPVETTVIGNPSVTFHDAMNLAIKRQAAEASGPGYYELPIKAVRDRGILPLPQ